MLMSTGMVESIRQEARRIKHPVFGNKLLQRLEVSTLPLEAAPQKTMFLVHCRFNRGVCGACYTLLKIVETVCYVGTAGFSKIEGL
jgi:hypothetical protein